jgi:chromosome segregation ATPase
VKTFPVVVAIGGMALLTLFALDRSCVSSRELAQAKADYAEQVRLLEAANAQATERIGQMTNDIAQRDTNILKLEESVTQKDARITLLSGQLANIVGQEPPTTPEIESLPIVINLRAQVKTLNEMFSLATETINDKDDIIREWEAKFNSQFKITMEWKAMYDNEHALRVQAEGLFKLSEQARKPNVWKTIGYIAGAAALGYVIGK